MMRVVQPESIIWYVVCCVVVCIRFVSKRMRLGSWKALQMDDYLVLPAMISLTVLTVLLDGMINIPTNLVGPNEDVSKFTSENVEARIYGSKLRLVTEQMQILTIWLLKASMLIMYSRLTNLLWLHTVVKGLMVYVGFSYLLMEILWAGAWCRPFSQYWAVPAYSTNCTAMTPHLITNAVLNISSDLMIILIPLPLVVKVQICLGRKLVLSAIFLIGIVTMYAAAYNKYQSFRYPFSPRWALWYGREAFTAMLCANLPLTKPFIQKVLGVRSWLTDQSTTYDGVRSNAPSRSHLRSTSASQDGFRIEEQLVNSTLRSTSDQIKPQSLEMLRTPDIVYRRPSPWSSFYDDMSILSMVDEDEQRDEGQAKQDRTTNPTAGMQSEHGNAVTAV